MERFVSLLGLVTMLLLAWLMSENRRRMNWRLIISGLMLQLLLAVLLLATPMKHALFKMAAQPTEEGVPVLKMDSLQGISMSHAFNMFLP